MIFTCPTHGAIEKDRLKSELKEKREFQDGTTEILLVQKVCPLCDQKVTAIKPKGKGDITD
jgi:hypothetical protein